MTTFATLRTPRSDAEARRLDVRLALMESIQRYRVDLTAAELQVSAALEQDNSDDLDLATARVEALRQAIRHLAEELAL